MARIGIYPGTFDLIHDGHVAFALSTVAVCGLDTVIFIPERAPRRKTDVSPLVARTGAIIERIKNEPLLGVREIADEKFSVATTWPILSSLYPGDQIVFLIGSDVALGLRSWPDIDTLTSQANFAIGIRRTANHSELDKALATLEINYELISTDKSHLSSSMYR